MKSLIVVATFFMTFLLGCSQGFEDFYTPAQVKVDGKWQELADYLGITVNKEDVRKAGEALGQQPASVDPSHPNNAAILGGIQSSVVAAAFSGQCHSIVGIRELPTKDNNSVTLQPKTDGTFGEVAVSGKVYVLKYKLRNSDGSEDTTVHTALVTRPDTIDESAGLPLLLYSHSGASGTSYAEIAGGVAGFQGSNIVAAPVFPGEPLCKTSVALPNVRDCGGTDNLIVPASGQLSIFNNDVLDLMGLHACMTSTIRSLPTLSQLDVTFASASETSVANPFVDSSSSQSKFATHITGTTNSGVKTLLFGTGRGGRVALLAAARAGIIMSDYGKASEGSSVIANAASNIDGFTYVPPTFSAIATLSAPVSGLVGLERIVTEHAVAQTLSTSMYASLPGMMDLQQTLASYANGTIDTAQAAILLASQDLIYMGAYLAAGVQNWSARSTSGTASKGAIFLAHTTNDLVVNISQHTTAFNLVGKIDDLTSTTGSPLEELPGYNYLGLVFQPNSDYANFCTDDPTKLCMISSTDYNHSLVASVLTARLANPSLENLKTAKFELGTTSESSVETLANNLFQGSGEITGYHKNIVRTFLVYRSTEIAKSFTDRSAGLVSQSLPKTYSLPPVTPTIAFAIWYALQLGQGGAFSAN